MGILNRWFSRTDYLRKDLRLQLLALYLLFVVPVVLAALAFDRVAARRLEADVKAADLALARAIAVETSTLMEDSLQTVRQLANYPEVLQEDRQGMERLFHLILDTRTDVNLVYRLDEQGIMQYHYPHGPGSTVGWDFSFRNYFQMAQNTRNPLVSEGRMSPTTQQLVTTAVMPLWSPEGRFLGLVATNIKLQALSHTLSAIAGEYPASEGFGVQIIDSNGRVIAHPNPQNLLGDLRAEAPEVTRAVLSRQSGNLILADDTGRETLYAYAPIPSAGWGVIVSRPVDRAFATPRATHRGILLATAIFLAIGLFFWLGLSHRVIRPLERLADFSRAIERKETLDPDLDRALERLAGRPDQIGHLTRSLVEMEAAIAARLQELSTLLEISSSVVSTLDPQSVLDRILKQVERLMGVQMCAIVALDEERGVFRVRASRGLSQRYAEQLAISPSEPYSVSLRALRNGQPVQVSDTERDASFSATRPRARAEGYRSLMAVPLNTQHAPPSALLVYRPDPHVFTHREIDLLTSFANHAAMAIENATLYARSDMRLQEQTRRLEALVQSFGDGLILEDLDGRVLYANRRIEELVNLSPEEISASPAGHLVERLLTRAVDREKARAEVDAALEGRGQRSVELALSDQRQVRYLRLQVFDVTDVNGTPIGRGQILRDITKNRELDRMKSSLISTVSHELRTPLAAIKGYATTLLAEDVSWDPNSQREFLNIISGETDRLTNLVNDLLDMSRIEAGNLPMSYERCSLEDLIYRAAQRAYPRPLNRLRVELQPDLPEFFADPQRIEVVLRNLIENSAKYSESPAPICVSGEVLHGDLVVRVEDRGIGIRPEESQRIFESFYQVENGLARQSAGAGLGLAISKGFVKAHGGDIWVEPRPVGTCIAFTIPLVDGPEAERSQSEPPGESFAENLGESFEKGLKRGLDEGLEKSQAKTLEQNVGEKES